MTIPGQVVLWPGQFVGENLRSNRELARTPDPCGADILRLDASGMFEIQPRALAVQPSGKILLLAELEGARNGLRLARLFPDGRIDDSYAAGASCLPGTRRLTTSAGGHALLYDDYRPGALLLDPEGKETARFQLLLARWRRGAGGRTPGRGRSRPADRAAHALWQVDRRDLAAIRADRACRFLVERSPALCRRLELQIRIRHCSWGRRGARNRCFPSGRHDAPCPDCRASRPHRCRWDPAEEERSAPSRTAAQLSTRSHR
jgi:hypothetical protein